MTQKDQKDLLLLGGAGAIAYILLSSKSAFGGILGGGSPSKTVVGLVEAMQNQAPRMVPVPGTGKTVNINKTYYWASRVVEVIKIAARGVDNMTIVRNSSQQYKWKAALTAWGQKVYSVGVSDPEAELITPSLWNISEYIQGGGAIGKWGSLNEMPKDISDKLWMANKVFAIEIDNNLLLAEKAKKLPTTFWGMVGSEATTALNWSAATFAQAIGAGVSAGAKGLIGAFSTTDLLIAGGAVVGILALVNKG